tara:strand:+ start:119715 stop:120152 length:438 start_codon:yes stop_codon:yes gene_type:complete
MKLTESYKETLIETVILLPRYIDKILYNIDCSINSINNQEDSEEEVIKIFDNLSSFISLVSIIFRDSIFQTYDNETTDVLKTLKIHQLSIVKALKSAMKNDDLLMLTDLLEYELKDNLTQWKISAIPQLKQALRRQKLVFPTTSY